MAAKTGAKRFIFSCPTRDLDRFKTFARQVAKLKSHGRVLVEVGSLAAKASHEQPEGGSAWHEYCSWKPNFMRVVPHPLLAPFVPARYVRKNLAFLRAKSSALRRLGLGASFHGQDPFYVPEAFLAKHPHLRGPRVDHPRRSRREEFAPCIDLAEVAEMYEWMMARLKRTVPELEAYFFNANDAGSGFCWAAALYSGPNGPRECRHKSAGTRVRDFLETLHRGARAGGGDVTLYIGGANFWHNEYHEVERMLPPDTFFARNTPTAFGTGSLTAELYPVRGLVNPLSILASMERFAAPEVRDVLVSLNSTYYRDCDSADTVEKVLEIMTDGIERPTRGLRERLEKLHGLCARWGGRQNADALFEAFVELDRLLRVKSALVHWMPMYTALTLRHLNRPLVFKPELLTSGEESYFLPFVFNTRESEARTDYADLHGGRMHVGSGDPDGLPALLDVLDSLRGVASAFEKCRTAPEGEWLFSLGTAVRVFIACTRSTCNFYYGQLVRDAHKAELAQEGRVPVKEASWFGEGQILRWNELVRDELDNVTELTALLEERGLDRLSHAEDARLEDTFLFGPGILGQLKKKAKIMRDHWLDVERFLAPPHK